MQLTKFSTFLFATIVAALLGAACAPGSIPFLGGGGSAQQRQQSHKSESTSETINGQEIDGDDARDDAQDDDDRAGDKRTASRDNDNDIGATCTKNTECGARACFVGGGELGYCTKICDSFSDCPMGWDCQRAGNAPQKICQQDQD